MKIMWVSEKAKLKTFAFYNLHGHDGERADSAFPREILLDLTFDHIKSASNLHTVKHRNLLRKVIE